MDIPFQLPDRVEVAAYYLVAEALANTNKHAQADRVSVRAALADSTLRVSVSDNGRGGAAAAPGSGLEGLADRISALGGQLVIDSPRDRAPPSLLTSRCTCRRRVGAHDDLSRR